jgi:6-pyruvoyltetrahydropterin/6-carboxytetrahydropterin synthase
MILVTRKAFFCAAHHYYDDALSEEENAAKFGRCINPHGHNYELEVTVTGEIDERSGMVVNLSEVDRVIRSRVIDLLDHKNLNADIEEFKTILPTTEMLARFIWSLLDGAIPGARLMRVRLHEDASLFVDYFGEAGG